MGVENVLSTKSAECVGQAALLATGQSFTATSDIWQPSRSPYTKEVSRHQEQFAPRRSRSHEDEKWRVEILARPWPRAPAGISQKRFLGRRQQFAPRSHEAHEDEKWRVEILARTGMGEENVLSTKSAECVGPSGPHLPRARVSRRHPTSGNRAGRPTQKRFLGRRQQFAPRRSRCARR